MNERQVDLIMEIVFEQLDEYLSKALSQKICNGICENIRENRVLFEELGAEKRMGKKGEPARKRAWNRGTIVIDGCAMDLEEMLKNLFGEGEEDDE